MLPPTPSLRRERPLARTAPETDEAGGIHPRENSLESSASSREKWSLHIRTPNGTTGAPRRPRTPCVSLSYFHTLHSDEQPFMTATPAAALPGLPITHSDWQLTMSAIDIKMKN